VATRALEGVTVREAAPVSVRSERELAFVAGALGAAKVGPLSPAERALAACGERPRRGTVAGIAAGIARGDDPLGDALCHLRSPLERRPRGATYTPAPIVAAMVEWSRRFTPARVIDPGGGSGRFAVAAGRAFPAAEVLAVEIDPLAALLARAHLAQAGLAGRARVACEDYRALAVPRIEAPTLFLGNPPYVRHHGIAARWKKWLTRESARLGAPGSQLSGLHVHFFLATALHGRPGDVGAFVTAAEWLDVNYGALVRRLLLGPLGATSLDVLEPSALPFDDADTTAAVACFQLGERPRAVRVRRAATVADLAPLGRGAPVPRAEWEAAPRWSPLTTAPRASHRARGRPDGFVELGELCRVHRGQVTGANAVWLRGADDDDLPLPSSLLLPAVTRARELFDAGAALHDADHLRRVLDLPADLDELPRDVRTVVERFLRHARRAGADRGFIARHRRAWWAVNLRDPAPILATYMARRPPAFVRNLASARHINIAHGLYPRDPMPADALDALARYLSTSTSLADGRTYAGGLTKFEPREMERLLVPRTLLAR